jgi:hypothetical protein
MTFLYASVFAAYAIARSSWTIARDADPSGLWSTLLENGVTLAYLCSLGGLVMAILSSIIGGVTALVIAKTVPRIRHGAGRGTAALAAFGIGTVLLCGGYLLLWLAVGNRVSPLYPETFWFWFGIPGIVYLAANVKAGTIIAATRAQEETP